jgi:hypothetical protein
VSIRFFDFENSDRSYTDFEKGLSNCSRTENPEFPPFTSLDPMILGPVGSTEDGGSSLSLIFGLPHLEKGAELHI